MDDGQLLNQYAIEGSQAAFGSLVRRYVGLVYSAARRQVGDPGMAEDVAQAVFVLLARRAGSIRHPAALAGWLIRVTRYAACEAMRQRQRRQYHEQQAASMRDEITRAQSQPAWETYAPVIDEAMTQLREMDRSAVVLRYLRGMTLREVGQTMGISEEAARKRVDRGIVRLRSMVARKVTAPSVGVLSAALAASSMETVPPGLAEAIISTAGNGGAGVAAATAQGVFKMMTWLKIKVAAMVPLGILITGSAAVVLSQTPSRSQSDASGSVASTPASKAAPKAAEAQSILQQLDDLVSQNAPLTPEFVHLYWMYSMRAASPRYLSESQPLKQAVPIHEHMDRLKHLQSLLHPDDVAQAAELQYELTRAQAILDQTLGTERTNATLASDLADVYEALIGMADADRAISTERAELICYTSWLMFQHDNQSEAHRQRLEALRQRLAGDDPSTIRQQVLRQWMATADRNKSPADRTDAATREYEALQKPAQAATSPTPMLIDMLCSSSLRMANGSEGVKGADKQAAYGAHIKRMADLSRSLRQRGLVLQACLAEYSASLAEQVVSGKR